MSDSTGDFAGPSDSPVAGVRERLEAFVRFRAEHLRGDEKGEAQIFLDRWFQALGFPGAIEAGAVLEERVRRQGRSVSFADLRWGNRVLIEMKKAGQNLALHYRQAFDYWIASVPNRPRYVILCNFDEVWIYDFDHQLDEPIDRLPLADLPRRWEALGFMLPEERRPQFGNDLIAVTRQSASDLAAIFGALASRGVPREQSRRFLLQCVMAMFSEDIGLLPTHAFTAAIQDSTNGTDAYDLLFGLFREMNTPGITEGGRYAGTPYFNGGLYSVIEPFSLTREEVAMMANTATTDWSTVRPEIFGTLFEQSLGKEERHALGAHYTSPADIAFIVEPSLVRPWTERIDAAWDSIPELEKALHDLTQIQVLDPACGCGNFLYIAYREMRRLEQRITLRIAERRRGTLGETPAFSLVSTHQFHGMDINPFACEIAKVTLMIAKKLSSMELDDHQNVLPLDNIDSNFHVGDALFSEWPAFDICIGNPPYLGRQRVIEEHGPGYSSMLADAFPSVEGFADYVSYWFQIAHDRVPEHGRVGLVGTNSIREGHTRRATLDYIVDRGGVINEAVSSLEWDGDAQVHVSIVNWSKIDDGKPKTLWIQEGQARLSVPSINTDLTVDIDLRSARPITANRVPKSCFQGQTPGHIRGFVLTEQEARDLAAAGSGSVIFPFLTGDDLNGSGHPERWIIDFDATDAALAQVEAPAAYDRVRRIVLPHRQERAEAERQGNQEILNAHPGRSVNWHHRNFLNRWWQLSYRRSDLISAINGHDRYIALSRYAVADRPSLYAFVDAGVRPADKIMAFPFSDDYSFGVIASGLHRSWFERRCTTLGQALSYTNTTVWDTFPWPQDPGAVEVGKVAECVADLLEFRHERVLSGIPLSAQYDALRLPGNNPLRDLHSRLDAAVRRAYGFSNADEDLAALLALNELVVEQEAEGEAVAPPGPGGFSRVRTTSGAITETGQTFTRLPVPV